MSQQVDLTLDDILFDVTVAPAISLAVSTPSRTARREKIARGIGEVSVNLLHGDCLDVLRTMEDCSVDSVVTDPPYGLANCSSALITETMIKWASGDRTFIPEGAGFMGKGWDAFVPPPAVWDEVFRVLKPGGHVVAFAGSRTQDLMGLSIRLAGFEIRDSVAWVYGSGFPKSMDLSKAIDKMHGAEREVVGSAGTRPVQTGGRINAEASIDGKFEREDNLLTAPATQDAIDWEGWGTALKPAYEPVIVARRPLSESTVAQNVLLHGTGAINIDGSRIESGADYHDLQVTQGGDHFSVGSGEKTRGTTFSPSSGRFPANIMFDEFTADLLDAQSGITGGKIGMTQQASTRGLYEGGSSFGDTRVSDGVSDSGGASRFFYVSKANKSERPVVDGVAHPTVKPLDVMRWLIKLITPPGGTVLEPFAGSGTTVEASILEGFDIIAIEREASYIPLIEARVARQLNG